MFAKSRIDLLLQRVEPLVTVKNVQLAKKRLAVLLATKFRDDLRAPGLGDPGKGDLAAAEASFDIGIRPAIGRQRK